MIFLTNEQIQQVLDMKTCIDAMEEAYRDMNQQHAGYRPRIDFYVPQEPHYYRWGTMEGASRKLGVFAIRMKSDMLAWENQDGFMVEDKYCMERGRYCGLIFLLSARNAEPLALMNDGYLQHMRVGACAGIGTKYLARKNSSVATICGCGEQGRAQLRALHSVLPLKKIYAFDLIELAANTLATELSSELKIDIEPVRDFSRAIQKSDVCVTCTPAKQFFVHKEDVAPGTFIAAVGADDAHKQEIDPALIVSAKVVTDSLEQSCAIGDTHHAIAQGLVRKENIYAELGEIVAGKKSGRTTDDEIIVFDSTGVATEDAVAAVAAYEKARTISVGTYFQFAA